MFFKTDAERAAAEASRARQDASEAGASAASGARNLGAAVLATLAEVTAPQDDTSGRKHAQKARAKALKAAQQDRESAAKAAGKARAAAGQARQHSRSALEKQSKKAGGRAAAVSAVGADRASRLAEDLRSQGEEAAKKARKQGKQTAKDARKHGEKAAKNARKQGKQTAKDARKHGTQAVKDARHQGEVLREQGLHAVDVLRDRSAAALDQAGPVGEAAVARAGAGAAALAGLAAATRDRAVSGVDHGIDVAVPRAQESIAGVAPAVDHVRDLINDELLPKIQQMLADMQVGKDRLLAQDEGVVAAVTGTPKPRKRRGGALITLGLLAAAGAGLAWWLAQQQRQPAADPWAAKETRDPWAASTSTTSTSSATAAPATTTAATAGAVGSTTEKESTMSNDAQETQGDHPVADDGIGEDHGRVGDGDAADGADAGVAAPSLNDDGSPKMLDTEQIDELGSDHAAPVEEQGEGEAPTEEIREAQARQGDALPHASDGDEDGDTPSRV
ncbi:hypothetical protein [uncultured Serinicoccus sp.]|uniref:hypothetical protein n=1 Tax=uncultured Serinicoccus sp. TaxID=735514 RepID=UPI00260F3C41|nr:hypothetical protein [uncultured Serinicoccus sp.]